MKVAKSTILMTAGLVAFGAASLMSAPSALALSTYIDPTLDASTAKGFDEKDPYITLQGVTYGQGIGGNNFEEYNKVTYVGSYKDSTLGLWQDSEPGTTTFDFWDNTGNNPVVSLQINGNDYLGVVSRQVKDSNTTLAFQWAAIDADAWYSNGTIKVANDPATYILWISEPQLTDQGTSSDPPLDNLNAELASQRAATSAGTTEGVPAPISMLLIPALAGFLPRLRRARALLHSSVEA